MRAKLYNEFDRVCDHFFQDLDLFEAKSGAENKAMLYADLERLTEQVQTEGCDLNAIVRQIRYRLPDSDVSHGLWNRLIWDGSWAEDLVDQLEGNSVALRVVNDLWRKSIIAKSAIEVAGYGAFDECEFV